MLILDIITGLHGWMSAFTVLHELMVFRDSSINSGEMVIRYQMKKPFLSLQSVNHEFHHKR